MGKRFTLCFEHNYLRYFWFEKQIVQCINLTFRNSQMKQVLYPS